MVILLEGGEKVGKTTLAREIVRLSRTLKVDAVHANNRGIGHPEYYMDLIRLGSSPVTLVVIDRAWPSDIVYSKLLDRPSALGLANLPLTYFETALKRVGLAYILAPKRRREGLDETDHQVSYDAERALYVSYGKSWKHQILTDWGTTDAAKEIIAKLRVIQQRW